MSSLQIIGTTKDLRTNTTVLYAQIKIADYLPFVGDDFDRFEIQRKKESHKGYKRLKKDIELGALIPTITLAVEPSIVPEYKELVESENSNAIVDKLLSDPEKIYILDGLQRTYIIKEIVSAGALLNEDQQLLLEIWLESNINHLIYRLIVLNSGQKPMSMRHQIELLFITMRETLTNEIPDLTVLRESDETVRTKAKEFPFERLVTSYKAFLTKSPEIDKDNIIAEKIIETDILDSEEEFLSASFLSFKRYLIIYCQLDGEVYRIYHGSTLNKYRNWLADGNVINSFFAALSKTLLNESREAAITKSLSTLLDKLRSSNLGDDPLELTKYSELRSEKANPKLYNVGFATRKLLTSAFVEFFKFEGEQSLGDCWLISSAEL